MRPSTATRNQSLTGTSTAPAFIQVTDSLPLNVNNFNYSVAVGDLNGDSKKDLVVGFYSLAKLRYFRNTGTLNDPVFTYTASQLDTMNLSQASAPCLADLDNDGDLDILVGNSSGRLSRKSCQAGIWDTGALSMLRSQGANRSKLCRMSCR